MKSIPAMSGREVIRTFENLGWWVDRQRGSHAVMVRDDDPTTLVIPLHREVRKGTLRALILDAGLTIDEFQATR